MQTLFLICLHFLLCVDRMMEDIFDHIPYFSITAFSTDLFESLLKLIDHDSQRKQRGRSAHCRIGERKPQSLFHGGCLRFNVLACIIKVCCDAFRWPILPIVSKDYLATSEKVNQGVLQQFEAERMLTCCERRIQREDLWMTSWRISFEADVLLAACVKDANCVFVCSKFRTCAKRGRSWLRRHVYPGFDGLDLRCGWKMPYWCKDSVNELETGTGVDRGSHRHTPKTYWWCISTIEESNKSLTHKKSKQHKHISPKNISIKKSNKPLTKNFQPG